MPSDPFPSMESFYHVKVISIIIGIILFIGLFSICYDVFLKNIQSNTQFLILLLMTFVVIAAYVVSYILYSIQILNIDGTLQVGRRALGFCGKNIYILDTGEYKCANGFVNFADPNMHVANNKLLKVSSIMSNVLLCIFYISIISTIIIGYYISPKDSFEPKYLGNNLIKTIIISIYGFSILSGIISTSVLSNIFNFKKNTYKSKDDINNAYQYATSSSIILLLLLISFPFEKIHSKPYFSQFISKWKTYAMNFKDLLVDRGLVKIIVILICFMILTMTLNNLISNSNNKFNQIFNNDYVTKYIYSSKDDTISTTLEGNLNKLCFVKNIGNANRSAIDTYWINYFKKNIKNAYSNLTNTSSEQIFGDDDSIVSDFKDDLWKFIQYNDGKEFDEIVSNINEYIDKNDVDTSMIPSNYQNLLINGATASTTPSVDKNKISSTSCANKQDIDSIIDSFEVINNIRKICFNLRNDKTITTNITNISKKFVMFSAIVIIAILYFIVHTTVKLGNRNILNYLVFISIIFAVIMSLYGWASGFTYI